MYSSTSPADAIEPLTVPPSMTRVGTGIGGTGPALSYWIFNAALSSISIGRLPIGPTGVLSMGLFRF